MHSVPFLRLRDGSRTSTSMGQTRLHLPQPMHLSASTRIRKSACRLMGFRNTVTGQTYFQKARLS